MHLNIKSLVGGAVMGALLVGSCVALASVPDSKGVIHACQTAPLTAPAGNTPVSVPLTAASWTQQPGEVDRVVGEVTVTVPATCTGGANDPYADFDVTFNVDGAMSGSGPGSNARLSGGTFSFPIVFSQVANAVSTRADFLFEPDTATGHTITATARDRCTGPGQDITIQSGGVDVIAIH